MWEAPREAPLSALWLAMGQKVKQMRGVLDG